MSADAQVSVATGPLPSPSEWSFDLINRYHEEIAQMARRFRLAPSFEGTPGWHDAVAAEVRAIRTGVALIDQTSFAKFELSGPGAQAALNRIAAADISGTPGRAIYTRLLNDRGGIEADVTIQHRGEEDFLIVTGSGFGCSYSGTLTLSNAALANWTGTVTASGCTDSRLNGSFVAAAHREDGGALQLELEREAESGAVRTKVKVKGTLARTGA